MNSLLKEEYTLEDFAKFTKKNPEYLRQCCRGYINSKKTKAELPDDFYSIPPKGWTIKPKKSKLLLQETSRINSLLSGDNSYLIEDLNTYKDFGDENYSNLTLSILKFNNKAIVLFDTLEHISNFITNGYSHLGDYLLFSIYQNLQQISIGLKSKISVTEVFIENIDLISFWIKSLGFTINNRNVIDLLGKKKAFCCYCGKIKPRKKTKIDPLDQHFCSKDHRAYYLYQKSRRLKNRKAKVSIVSEPEIKKFAEELKKIFLLSNNFFNQEDNQSQLRHYIKFRIQDFASNIAYHLLIKCNHDLPNLLPIHLKQDDLLPIVYSKSKLQKHFRGLSLKTMINREFIVLDGNPIKSIKELKCVGSLSIDKGGLLSYREVFLDKYKDLKKEFDAESIDYIIMFVSYIVAEKLSQN